MLHGPSGKSSGSELATGDMVEVQRRVLIRSTLPILACLSLTHSQVGNPVSSDPKNCCKGHNHMYYSLNSFKGVIEGDYYSTTLGLLRGGTRSLDYSSVAQDTSDLGLLKTEQVPTRVGLNCNPIYVQLGSGQRPWITR